MKKKVLVVLSGGQDSTMCLDIACRTLDPSMVHAVTFNYGQHHARELEAARHIAYYYGVSHEIVDVGPILKSTSPLTNTGADLEQYSDFETMDRIIGDRVEKTFVPMRNALFIILAANRAVCVGAIVLMTGVCQADNANYPDCTAEFIDAQQAAINQALGYERSDDRYIGIHAPLMHQSKAESVIAFRLGSPHFAVMALTHTAYDGAYPPVGKDHATVLRAQGFYEAGLPDPLVIRAHREGLMPLPDTSNYADTEVNNRLAAQISEIVASVKAHVMAGVA